MTGGSRFWQGAVNWCPKDGLPGCVPWCAAVCCTMCYHLAAKAIDEKGKFNILYQFACSLPAAAYTRRSSLLVCLKVSRLIARWYFYIGVVSHERVDTVAWSDISSRPFWGNKSNSVGSATFHFSSLVALFRSVLSVLIKLPPGGETLSALLPNLSLLSPVCGATTTTEGRR